MKVKILAFGIAKDIFGAAQIGIELGDDASVGDMKELLEQKYPRLAQLSSYMVAVNNEYAHKDLSLDHADEIAIIPPVSGG